MTKYGPSRSELKLRIGIGLAGLGLLGGALVYRGLPTGPGGWEAVAISVLFFGGTLGWSLRKLLRGDYPDNS